ncbi:MULTISPECIES: replication-relaxation family protein [unclassified Nocardia]|uniref:replication-relaxation family protein n=1 Tax=unclassified Nocardia TaxID=2637762 RepID=UPI001CE3D965|nr:MULTISPECIES: replication-relaxation family protein [unclassified Nocardia]
MIIRPTRQAALRAPVRWSTPARLVQCLTERDRWILRMCHEHRVLTTPQLAALGFASQNLARRRLAALHRYLVLDRFRPLREVGSAPAHWVLAPAGAAVLAAEAGVEVKDLGYRSDRALAVAHSLHLAHTLGTNEWFTALATDIGGTPAGTLLAWWSEARCRALWGDLARPDGYARYTRDRACLDFFLEYDLGTMALSTVAAKLHGYADLARSSAVITPVLLWLPTVAREAAARQKLHEVWTGLPDPGAVPVATAAAELLDPAAASPATRVWLPLDPAATGGRVELHRLPAAWPHVPAPPSTVPDPPTSRHAILTPPPPRPPSETGTR